jgi:hypothetical protein
MLSIIQGFMTVLGREGADPTSGFLGPVQDLGGSSAAVTAPSGGFRVGMGPWTHSIAGMSPHGLREDSPEV